MERLVLGRQGEDGGASLFAHARGELLHRGQIDRQGPCPRRSYCWRAREVLEEPAELELDEQRPRLVFARRPADQIAELNGNRQILVELDELAGPAHGLDGGERVLAQLGLLDLAGVLEDSFERSVLGEQRRGSLLAHAGDARNVVDLVAGQREEVGDFRGRHAPLVLHFLGPVPLLVHGVVAADAVLHELEQVLVAGHHHDFEAFLARPPRQGGDDVVGFPSGHAHGGNVEGLEDAAHERELGSEVLRHRAARGLVLGVDLAARLLGLLVEADGEVGRLTLADGLEQHGGEAVDGVGRNALPGREVRQRVVRAKDRVRSVDQPEGGHEVF